MGTQLHLRSFHGRSSLCNVSGKKGTHSTGLKVKGMARQTEKFFREQNPLKMYRAYSVSDKLEFCLFLGSLAT